MPPVHDAHDIFTTLSAKGVAPGPVVEGWLSKRAQDMGKTWMNRWFVLNYNGVLSYGKEQASQDKKIFLDKSTRVRPLIHPTATEEAWN
eukprot:g27189.t1